MPHNISCHKSQQCKSLAICRPCRWVMSWVFLAWACVVRLTSFSPWETSSQSGLRNIRPAGRYEQMLSCNDRRVIKPSEVERHWEPFRLGSPEAKPCKSSTYMLGVAGSPLTCLHFCFAGHEHNHTLGLECVKLCLHARIQHLAITSQQRQTCTMHGNKQKTNKAVPNEM